MHDLFLFHSPPKLAHNANSLSRRHRDARNPAACVRPIANSEPSDSGTACGTVRGQIDSEPAPQVRTTRGDLRQNGIFADRSGPVLSCLQQGPQWRRSFRVWSSDTSEWQAVQVVHRCLAVPRAMGDDLR